MLPQHSDNSTGSMKVRCPACNQKLDLSGFEPFTEITCPVCDNVFPVPCRFGPYVLEEELGGNALATVYRGLDLKLEREVCVKILRPETAANAKVSEQLQEWIRRIAVINHPNIVPIYASGKEDERPFVVMEYLPGRSLKQRMRKAPKGFPVSKGLQIASQVVDALRSALEYNTAHQGLNPSNLLFGNEEVVKVSDFGMRTVRQAAMNSKDSVKVAAVSSVFMSPELQAQQRQDYRGDIYSLGAILYYMLTGVFPTVRNSVGSYQPRRATLLDARKDIPKEVNSFLDELMAYEPSQRPDYETIQKKINGLMNTVRTIEKKGRMLKSSARPQGRSVAKKLPNEDLKKKKLKTDFKRLFR